MIWIKICLGILAAIAAAFGLGRFLGASTAKAQAALGQAHATTKAEEAKVLTDAAKGDDEATLADLRQALDNKRR